MIYKKVFYKVADATGEFIGNKIADQPRLVSDANSRNVEEINIQPEKYEKH